MSQINYTEIDLENLKSLYHDDIGLMIIAKAMLLDIKEFNIFHKKEEERQEFLYSFFKEKLPRFKPNLTIVSLKKFFQTSKNYDEVDTRIYPFGECELFLEIQDISQAQRIAIRNFIQQGSFHTCEIKENGTKTIFTRFKWNHYLLDIFDYKKLFVFFFFSYIMFKRNIENDNELKNAPLSLELFDKNLIDQINVFANIKN
jgi:hypothetical protein